MTTLTGLDVLCQSGCREIQGKNIGLVCNQSSLGRDLRHVTDHLLPPMFAGQLCVKAVFGPQHGLWGHTQDNMIEWEGYRDRRTGLRVYSLYGAHRKPTKEMLDGVDLMLVDLPDVGSRYYTFIWTMAHCMETCQELGIPMTVLDRPNPIGGTQVEGPVLDPQHSSFVGLYPLPIRHGLTIGEVAVLLRSEHFPKLDLNVVRMKDWSREAYYDETGQPWAMPSPNMPTLETAVVYPGGCLLEATKLSEGRGTTRPFEIFGAPYIDGWELADCLNRLELPGCYFRPYQFEPTFHKFAKEVCEGAFLHVTDRRTFEPVLAYIAIIQEVIRQCGEKFEWRPAPYEYEYEKEPIDILAGQAWVKESIEDLTPIADIRERMGAECSAFEEKRKAALLY